MQHLKDVLKCILLLAVIALCVKTIKVLDSVDQSVAQLHDDVHASTVKANAVLDDTHALITESSQTVIAARYAVNQARPKILLALEDSHHLLLESGLTAMEVRKAAVEQRAYWNQTGKETVSLLAKVNAIADGLDKTSVELNASLAATTKAVQSADKAIQHADAVISDPAIPSVLHHGDAILADGQKVADRLAQPVATTKRVLSFAWNSFLHWVGAK